MVYPCPLFSGAKPSSADGKFLVLFGVSLVHAPLSSGEKNLNLITLQQTRFQTMSENIISKNILKSFLLLIYFFYVFKIFNMQSIWHSNYFILGSRNINIINSVTAAFTIVCQYVFV